MKTPIRVAVAGARGKMGAFTIGALREAEDVEFVGGLVRDKPADADEYADLAELVAEMRPDVLVDFSVFPASKAIAIDAIGRGVRPVIGASGYAAADVQELRAAVSSRGIGCVFAPNFAIGAVLMMKFSVEAARHFSAVEIVEMHESGKKDAPSGTAMATARAIGAVRTLERAATKSVIAEGARGADVRGVGVHSLRLPGVVTNQEVRFGGDGELLSIAHASSSRASFMPGVLLAVRAADGLTRFVDGLGELL
ncbi:MAG TPA: 4-hydroxy-tetrahydrodipicolinate reductase [Candidatus Eremiobacteraceae bacterium]|nr:4-hydroxy-tetrahydrodipicolinate reductase [Candidatus Eremiobacteraceae bacterium]